MSLPLCQHSYRGVAEASRINSCLTGRSMEIPHVLRQWAPAMTEGAVTSHVEARNVAYCVSTRRTNFTYVNRAKNN